MHEVEVARNVAGERWEARLDGSLVGIAEYAVVGPSLVFHHTEVEPDYRGHGIASALARSSLDAVRAGAEFDVIPQCAFYRRWIDQHPEYADLVHRDPVPEETR